MSVRRIAAAGVSAFALAAASVAGAQEFIKPGTETFKFNFGGILAQNNLDVRIDGPNQGTGINVEDLLGLDSATGSYYVSASFRFASRHRLSVQYTDYKRDGSKVIDQEIDIGGQVIPVNTNLATDVRQQLVIANYEYSFVKTDQLEVAALLGLYGGKFEFKFNADRPIVDVVESTTLPLPMIGASLDWYVTPRWTVSLAAEGFKAKVADVDGTAWNFGISTDYMLWRNLGIGIGANAIGIDAEVTKSGFTGKVDTRNEFVRAYLQLRF